MKTVVISKEKLLKKIKENRESHRKTFEEAFEGWKNRVLEELEKAMYDAKFGRDFRTYFNLPQPEDHTPEYDAVIDQITWSEQDTIELDFHQFDQFVRDDWGWKQDFLSNTSMYMKLKT